MLWDQWPRVTKQLTCCAGSDKNTLSCHIGAHRSLDLHHSAQYFSPSGYCSICLVWCGEIKSSANNMSSISQIGKRCVFVFLFYKHMVLLLSIKGTWWCLDIRWHDNAICKQKHMLMLLFIFAWIIIKGCDWFRMFALYAFNLFCV